MKMRVVVCGGRDFQDRELCFKTLDGLLEEETDVEIVTGGAGGADALGAEYAQARARELTVFKPEWDRFGKSAGPVRNRQMVSYAGETRAAVVAFWDGASPGTASTISFARQAGLETHVIRYQSETDDGSN